MDDTDGRELGQDFRFFSSVRNIFPAIKNNQFSSSVNLISSASKFGLVFIAFGSEIKVYHSADIIDDNNPECFSVCKIPGRVTHLAVNCDNMTLLAAGNNLAGLPFAFFFDIRVFVQKGNTYDYFYAAPLSAFPSSCVESVSWNPTDPGCLSVAISTGQISLIQLKEKSVLFTTVAVGASFVTWSAKGKQLAVGTHKGNLELFKTDLTHVRSIQPPKIADIGAVVSIIWFSNTEFFVSYRKNGAFPNLFLVTSPKNSAANYVNMDDICYSGDNSSRPHKYYSIFIPEWSLLFALSSHSSDMAILGKSAQNPANWTTWLPEEGFRASLQFINVVEETFPLGFCSVFSSKKMFPDKDDTLKGPLPVFLSLTTGGQLNIFHVENKINGDKPLNIATEVLSQTGTRTSEQYGTTVVTTPAAESPPPTQSAIDNNKIFASNPTNSSNSKPLPQAAPEPTSPIGQFTNAAKPQGFGIAPEMSMLKNTSGQIITRTPIQQDNLRVIAGVSASPFSGQQLRTNSNIPSPVTGANDNIPSQAPFSNQFIQGNSISVSKSPLQEKLQINSSNASTFPFTGQNNSNIAVGPSSQLQQTNSKFDATPTIGVQTFQSQSNIVPQPKSASPVVKPVAVPSSTVSTPVQGQTSVLPSSDVNHGSTHRAKSNQSAENEKAIANLMPKRVKAKLMQEITAELVGFEMELVFHEKTNSEINFNIGTKEDKKAISNLVSGLGTWMADMNGTIEEQNTEISVLHEGALENCALYEDAKAQASSNKSVRNQTYAQFRPLDPYCRRKLDEIRTKYQYLRTQISEINAMLDSEWQNYNTGCHKKMGKYGGMKSEMIHHSVLNLRKMRHSVEAQVDQLCSMMKTHNLGSFLLPPDINDSGRTVNGDANTPRMGGKMSSKNMENLQQFLSERKYTPVRNFSTPKRNVSTNGTDMDLSLNQKDCSEISSNQNPLLALKSFVSNTTAAQKIDQLNTPNVSLEILQKSLLMKPSNMVGVDDAVWKQYVTAMIKQMGCISSIQQPSSSAAPAFNNCSSSRSISSTSTILNDANIFPTTHSSNKTGLNQSAGLFPVSKPTFSVSPKINPIPGTQPAVAGSALQFSNTGKMFNSNFKLPAVEDNNPNSLMSIKPTTDNNVAPVGGIKVPIIPSPTFMNQPQFSFTGNVGSTGIGRSSHSSIATFGTGTVNPVSSKSETLFSQPIKQNDSNIINNSQISISVFANDSNSNVAVSRATILPETSISIIPTTSQSGSELQVNKTTFGSFIKESIATTTQQNNNSFSSPILKASLAPAALPVKAVDSLCEKSQGNTSNGSVDKTHASYAQSICNIGNQAQFNASSRPNKTVDTGVASNDVKLSAAIQPTSKGASVQPTSENSLLVQPSSLFSFRGPGIVQPTLCNSPNTSTTIISSVSTQQISNVYETSSPGFGEGTIASSVFSVEAPAVSSVLNSSTGNFSAAAVITPDSNSSGNLTTQALSGGFNVTPAISSSNMFPTFGTSANVSAFGSVESKPSSVTFGWNPPSSTTTVFEDNIITSNTTVLAPSSSKPGESIFGGSAPSIFGNEVNTAASASIFGPAASVVTTSSSIFGGSPAVNNFGLQSSNTIGSVPVSGSSAFSLSTTVNKPFGNNIFGGNSSQNSGSFQNNVADTGSVFGKSMQCDDVSKRGANVGFGNSSTVVFNTPSGSVFGGSSSTYSFGTDTNVTPKGFQMFGDNSANSSQTQSAFSGLQMCSDLGGTPDPVKASQNVFGGSPSGNVDTSLFKPNPLQPAVFHEAKPTAPAFGAASSFGNSASFGAAPSFGSAAFGGGSVFGGTNSPVQTSTSFQDNSKSIFSNQADSSSFGSLAQKQTNDTFGKSAFGGNSFSSWRS